MKVIVSGAAGRMGTLICSLAAQGFAGAELAAAVSRRNAGAEDSVHFASIENYQGEADVVIDFSNHSNTAAVIDYCKARKLPVVVATTGQSAEEKEIIKAAAEEIPVFFSANMSIGVALLAELARKAAAMFPNADIEIIELHHNQKLDVPSGTALMLANAIKDARPEAEFLIGRHENGKRTQREIGIHSVRIGNEVGTHEILISTGSETITLKHEAENRSLFAEGAMTAAAYICGRQPGMYGMKDILA